MKAGIKWRWETFPSSSTCSTRLPKGINYAGYIGHCALRTYVMGQRAFTDEATEDEITTMAHHVREAIAAGAHRLLDSTRSVNHHDLGRQAGGEPPRHLGRARDAGAGHGRVGSGIVEIAGAPSRRRQRDGARSTMTRLSSLAIETGRPITFGLFSSRALARCLAHARFEPSIERQQPQGGRIVRPGAQPGAERAALLRDAAAVRQVGDVARHAQAAARRAEAVAARRRQAPQAGRDRLAVRTKVRRCAAPKRGRRSGS